MNIKRILLMVPPVTRPASYGADKLRVSPFFPLGLAYLAAVLRDRYEVGMLDCLLEDVEQGPQHQAEGLVRYGLRDSEIAYEISRFKPDVVGISCLFSAQEYDAKLVCRLTKWMNPEIVTVMGGPHAGANAREIMDAEKAVDYVVTGEGEESFPELLRALAAGEAVDVEGITYRAAGKAWSIVKHDYISDLSALPLPAWDMFDMEGYLRHMQPHDRCRQRPFMPVSTSRGCPYRCTFCAIRGHWGERPRFRPAEHVLAEIKALVGRYGVREVHFEDDNLTADKERALAIFRGMRQFTSLSWAAPSGLAMRNLDGELLDAMAASGCYSVSLAIESGNQHVLRWMRKPVDLERVPSLVKDIQSRGMLAKGFFILGYPGETKETIARTIEFAKSLQLDWAFFFVASPLPHTEMWEQAQAGGMIGAGDFNPLTSMHEPVIRLPGVEPEWLAERREQAIRETCFEGNPNITRNPAQAIADFEHVLGLYPDSAFSPVVREALERAVVEQGRTRG